MAYEFVQDPVRLHAGATAPRSGVYRVHHQRHRMPHLVIILEGDTLPPCKHCGDRVEFSPFMHAEAVDADLDLERKKARKGSSG